MVNIFDCENIEVDLLKLQVRREDLPVAIPKAGFTLSRPYN